MTAISHGNTCISGNKSLIKNGTPAKAPCGNLEQCGHKPIDPYYANNRIDMRINLIAAFNRFF
jgi:hypothetical protein